ncbi:hypothetical protein BDW66DRAFT_145259 [Aspergillus desertorum]
MKSCPKSAHARCCLLLSSMPIYSVALTWLVFTICSVVGWTTTHIRHAYSRSPEAGSAT